MFMQTELRERYGVLMTLADLAITLNRSQAGLRQSLARKSRIADLFSPAKRKIGRRIYFDSFAVAAAIDQSASDNCLPPPELHVQIADAGHAS